jgi:hypothetical protein
MNHDRAFIAYHEAGHAVADIVFEHDLGAVTIEPDGERAGGVEINRPDDDDLRYQDATASQVKFERRIMSSMAGEIAQRRFDPASVDPDHAAGDRVFAADYFDELDTPTDEIFRAYHHLLTLRTEYLVEKYWPHIQRVAIRLLDYGTLTADEARDAFVDPLAFAGMAATNGTSHG